MLRQIQAGIRLARVFRKKSGDLRNQVWVLAEDSDSLGLARGFSGKRLSLSSIGRIRLELVGEKVRDAVQPEAESEQADPE